MSDFDNIREDRYSDRQEREEKARQESIDFHAENWMVAVTKSVEKSHGTFADVTDYEAAKSIPFDLSFPTYPKRTANSIDVFIEELHNKDFMERAAKILIDLHKFGYPEIDDLFESMAANYADYQYENSIKD